jgi:hypothetical protein
MSGEEIDIIKIIGDICLNSVVEVITEINADGDIFLISSLKANKELDKFKVQYPEIKFDNHDEYIARFYLIPGNLHFLIKVKM